MFPAADKAAEEWRREKRLCARKLKAANDRKLKATEKALLCAAKKVLNRWSEGDLAEAVRELDISLKNYEETRK